MSRYLKKRKFPYGGYMTPEERNYYESQQRTTGNNSMANAAIGNYAGAWGGLAMGFNTAADKNTSEEIVDPYTGKVTRKYNSQSDEVAGYGRKPTHEYASESFASGNYGRGVLDLMGIGKINQMGTSAGIDGGDMQKAKDINRTGSSVALGMLSPSSGIANYFGWKGADKWGASKGLGKNTTYDSLVGKNNDGTEASEEVRRRQTIQDNKYNEQVLSNYATKGVNGSQLYKHGGFLKRYFPNGGSLVKIDYDRDSAPRKGNYLLPDINRPSYIDSFGNSRSEYKIGINVNGKEVLIPTVINGEQLTEDEAIKRYKETGYHMGIYNTIDESNTAAQKRTAKYNFMQHPIESQGTKIYHRNGGFLNKSYADGGNLIPISNEASLVQGNTHEEGGVDMGNGNEVEDKEVVTLDGKVFSAKSGFAQKALAITQSPMYKLYEQRKTRYEQEANNPSAKTTDKNTAKRNYEKLASYDLLDRLFEEQTAYNNKQGISNTGETGEFKYGGELDEFGNPITEPYNGNTFKKYGMWNDLDNNKSNINNNINPSSPIYNTEISQNTNLETKQPNKFLNNNDNTNSTFSNSNNFSRLGNNGQFIDNVVNMYLTKNTPSIPNQALTTPARLKTTVNIEPQLNDMQNQFTGLSKNLDRSTTDRGLALSNKQMGFSSLLKGRNDLFGKKFNLETELKNNAAMNLQDVEAKNNAIDYDNKFKQALRKGDIQDRISKNAANLGDDFRYRNIDKQTAENDKTAISLYYKALNTSGVMDRKTKGEMMQMLGLKTDAEFNNWKKNNIK